MLDVSKKGSSVDVGLGLTFIEGACLGTKEQSGNGEGLFF
jgi:hypothetical protein